jgi:CRP/FNR family cyclic AMP-dependent transcriptional regulator
MRNLFRQGDPASAMYVVVDGEVTMSIATPNDQELVVATMRRGGFFGELAMLDGSPSNATANVIRRTKLLQLQREDFVELLARQPKLAVDMLSSIATRLRTTNEMFARRVARNVNEEIDQHYRFTDLVADHYRRIWWELVVPFPHMFLNLVLNVICAVQAPIIMMSQNRQSAKDRLAADLDYQLNLKLEMQIQELHLKVDELEQLASSAPERRSLSGTAHSEG